MKVTDDGTASCGMGWRQGVVAVVVLCFLAFVGGAAVGDFRVWPYGWAFEGPFSYVHAMGMRRANEKAARDERAGAPARGTVTVSEAGALDGYTFLTFDAARPSTARLIDMKGNVVHEWRRPLSAVWGGGKVPNRERPVSDSTIAWRYAELSANGDVLVSMKSDGDTPDGYGLVKLDKDSKVIWALGENVHHHFSVGADGRIYALAHDWRDLSERPVTGLGGGVGDTGTEVPVPVGWPRRVLEDSVLEVSPEGKVISRVSILEAMASSGYGAWLTSAAFERWTKPWDRMHPNDVEVISEAFAAKHPSFMKAGQVLVSLRDLDALVVIDLPTKAVTWAMRGPWMRQHDPDLLENGDVMLFDNRGRAGEGGESAGSRVLEFDPGTGRVVWAWGGTAAEPLRSDYSGGEQVLGNGDVLISEDDAGRVREVTREGKVVWEYKDVRLHHAWRVGKGFVKFELNGKAGAGAGTAVGVERSAKHQEPNSKQIPLARLEGSQ